MQLIGFDTEMKRNVALLRMIYFWDELTKELCYKYHMSSIQNIINCELSFTHI